MSNKVQELKKSRVASALVTPTDLSPDAVRAVSEALNAVLADTFALYVKTKNFHWHISGPHFRSYHLLLDEQSEQVLATVDELAERVRKIGGTTLRSIGESAKRMRIRDNDKDFVSPLDMLSERLADNKGMIPNLPAAHT